jgi:hypothetical protein
MTQEDQIAGPVDDRLLPLDYATSVATGKGRGEGLTMSIYRYADMPICRYADQ